MVDGYLLRYFLAVVEAGSFTAAAARMNVTQPTLSAGIAKIEKELGARLFVRSARRIELTAAGSSFLVRARNIVQEYNFALGEITGDTRRRALRFGVLHTVPAYLVGDIVRRWNAIDTVDGIELVEGTDAELLSRLEQGRIDMALSLDRPLSERFSPIAVYEEGYTLALASGHRLAGKSVIEPEALHSDPMIIRRRCEVLNAVSRHFTSRGVRPPLAYRTVQEERALEMVAAGLGVTVLPACYVHPGVVQPRLAGFDQRRTLAVLTNPLSMALRRSVDGMTRIVSQVFGERQVSG